MKAKGRIRFFFEEVSIPGFSQTKVRDWILLTCHAEDKAIGDISVIFCNDTYLQKMNFDYLNHEELTDVITFDYQGMFGNISGDVFISIDRVKENSEFYQVAFLNELHRVIIHGVLHLLGYVDHESALKALMASKENYYLSLLA